MTEVQQQQTNKTHPHQRTALKQPKQFIHTHVCNIQHPASLD